MAVDERRRHEMYLSLERALGREGADTLMELVPPVGWADVATKQDLSALEDRMILRFQVVDARFDKTDEKLSAIESRILGTLNDKLRKQAIFMTTLFLTVIGIVVAAVGIVVAAASR